MVDLINQQSSSTGLDFSKGFQYQNQDLGNVQISEKEDKKLKRERMEKYLGVSISNEAPKEDVVRSYVKGLNQSDRAVVNHLADEGYSYNEIVAYMGQKDKFANPMATGTGIFERKPHQFDPRNPLTQTATGLGAAEGVGALLENRGKKIMKSAYGESKKDVLKDINYKANEELKSLYGSKANKIDKQIEQLVKEGGDEQKLLELQKERERLRTLEKKYTMEAPKSTADVATEFGLVGDERNLASSSIAQKKFMWTEEVQPLLDKSNTKWKITDFLDDLKYEDFGNINEYNRKEYQAVIDDMKKTYAEVPEKSLAELYDWKKRTQLSSNAIKGDESKSIVRNIQDKLYTKVNDAITTTLDAENKGMGVGDKIKKYGLLTEFEEGAKKGAIADAAKANKPSKAAATPMELAGKEINEVKASKKFKTNLGKTMKTVGENIRPSTWVKKILKNAGASEEITAKILNAVNKGEKIPSKLRKGGGKVLSTLAPILDIIAVADETSKALDRWENADMPFNIQNKMLWKMGYDKGTEYEGWTEEDWANAGLGQDVIRDYLDSDEFQERLDKTTYKWTGGRERSEKAYRTMYY